MIWTFTGFLCKKYEKHIGMEEKRQGNWTGKKLSDMLQSTVHQHPNKKGNHQRFLNVSLRGLLC